MADPGSDHGKSCFVVGPGFPAKRTTDHRGNRYRVCQSHRASIRDCSLLLAVELERSDRALSQCRCDDVRAVPLHRARLQVTCVQTVAPTLAQWNDRVMFSQLLVVPVSKG